MHEQTTPADPDPAEVTRYLELGYAQRALIRLAGMLIVVHFAVYFVLVGVMDAWPTAELILLATYGCFRAAITVPLILINKRLMRAYGYYAVTRCAVTATLVVGVLIPFINLVVLSQRVHDASKMLKRAGFSPGLNGVPKKELESFRQSPWPLPKESDPFRPEES